MKNKSLKRQRWTYADLLLDPQPWAGQPYAPLEYWFFKTNAGEVALLVDWIARRQTNTCHLRLSVHTPYYRTVAWETVPLTQWPNLAKDFELSGDHTFGQMDKVAWDLYINLHPPYVSPDIFPARHLALPDMVLTSAPLATFTGWIVVCDPKTVTTFTYKLDETPGLVSHYWGRQLNPDWWWVSASQFDRSGVVVECVVCHTSVWGLPLNLPLGYLYLRQPEGSELWMSPPARVQVSGTLAAFTIEFKPWGAPPITLKAAGREYGDFGENISNTLVGDLAVWVGDQLLAQAHSTAGLERRVPV